MGIKFKNLIELALIISIALFFGTLKQDHEMINEVVYYKKLNYPFLFMVLSVELILYLIIIRYRERK